MSQYKNYREASEETYRAHRKMMDDFNEKYPILADCADTLLIPTPVEAPMTRCVTPQRRPNNSICPDAPRRVWETRGN